MSIAVASFEDLYRTHYGFVASYARRLGVEHGHLDDITQEVFLVAYRRLHSVKPEQLRPWLYAIARRVVSNARRGAFRASRKQRAAGEVSPQALPAPRYETVLAIDEFLRTLSPNDRELFVLSEIEGLTGLEAATALRLKSSTAYARLKVLKLRLHERMDSRVITTAMAQCRRERPQATARGWLALLPLLKAPARASLVSWAGSISTATAFAVPAVLAAVAGASLALANAASQVEPTPRPSAAPIVSTVATPARASFPLPPVEVTVSESAEGPAVAPFQRPRTRHSKSAFDASPPADPHDLGWQAAQLRRATQALRRGEPEVALQIIAAFARVAPTGPLADARIALRIEALCASGRVAHAQAEAAAFLKAFPGSGVVPRIQRSCASGSGEGHSQRARSSE